MPDAASMVLRLSEEEIPSLLSPEQLKLSQQNDSPVTDGAPKISNPGAESRMGAHLPLTHRVLAPADFSGDFGKSVILTESEGLQLGARGGGRTHKTCVGRF